MPNNHTAPRAENIAADLVDVNREVPDNSASTGGGDEDFGGGFDEADGQTAGLMEMMAMAEKRRASLLEADEEEEEEEDEDESDDDDATPPAAPDDDDDEGKFEGEDEDFDGDAFDDDAAAEPPAQKEKFDPFRVVCTAAFDGMEEGASAFVIGEADDDNWQVRRGRTSRLSGFDPRVGIRCDHHQPITLHLVMAVSPAFFRLCSVAPRSTSRRPVW